MRGNADLIAGAIWSLAASAAALSGLDSGAARVSLGLPFVLFWPGYSLVAALFPAPERLHVSQRLATAVGLSIAITVVVGLALNYSPWGVRLVSIVSSLIVVVLLGVGTAGLRRRLQARQTPPAARDLGKETGLSRRELAARAPAAVILVAAAAFAVALYLAASSGTKAERFTEFYVVGPDGGAEGYPNHLRAGESANLVLGLVNQEGADSTYRVVMRTDGRTAQVGQVLLASGKRREQSVKVALPAAGRQKEVQFLLYKDGAAAPYRRLRLRLNVEPAAAVERVADRTAPVGAVAPAAQGPAASAEPPPAPRVHVVTGGENLTFIARDYGVPLSAVVAANEFENPNLIYPQQQIVIPGGAGD